MKTHLRQGAAIAALSFAIIRPVWAIENTVTNTPSADDPSAQAVVTTDKRDTDLQMTPVALAATGQETLVAQAATPAPNSAPIQVAQAATPQTAIEPEQILVSATRRETLLQQTPIAITAVQTDQLVEQHAQSLLDLAGGSVPYLRVATFEARQSALTVGIRGIVPFDENQTAREPGVGVYLDGVYLGRSQGLNMGLLDVERIEVLRGPQGTLFGRNTEGGAVSIISKAPSGEFDGRVVAGIGNFGSYNTALYLDLPAVAHIAVKVDGMLEHQDPTTGNPLAGQVGWDYFNRYGGRIAARWTPIPDFTGDFVYDSGVDQNTPFYSQLVNYNPLNKVVGVYDPTTNRLVAPGSPAGAPTCGSCIAPLSPLVQVHTDRQTEAEIGVPQQPSVDKANGFMSTLNYELSAALTLRSITAFRGVSTDQWDNSGGAHRTIFAPNANFSRYSLSMLRQHQFSEELQAVGSIPQLDYLFGLYYFHENATEKAATPSSNKWNATGTGYTINSEIAFGPITSANQGWQPSSWLVQRNSSARASSFSVFGQATYTPEFFDMLHLTAGGRYTQDQRDGALIFVNGLPANFTFKFDNNRFDPLVTLSVDAAPDIHLYATYSTGFRAGGANDRSQTFHSFGPESVKSYEIGAKTDWFDRRVLLNLAGYYMTRSGTQTDFDNVDTNPNSPTFNLHTEETRNAPSDSTIKGIEAEFTFRLTDELSAGASYAYTYWKVPPTPNPFLGNVLFPVVIVYTPPNAASAYINYDLPLGGGMIGQFHVDAAYADPDYSFQAEPTVKTDSSFIVNGSLQLANIPVGMSSQTLTLNLWVRNLFDETHIYRRSGANRAVLGDYANFNPPRTFGLQGTVRF